MRIQVTAANIEHVPLPNLLQRARALQRKKDRVSQDERGELELIQKYIGNTKACGKLAEQLELDLPRPKREQYMSIVVDKLLHFNYYKRQLAEINGKLQSTKLNVRFPSSRVAEPIQHKATVNSSIEVAVVEAEKEVHKLRDLKQELEAVINPIERVLTLLKPEERQLIEKRFLQRSGKTDIAVMMDMEIGRQKYYQLKAAALIKIAESLHII